MPYEIVVAEPEWEKFWAYTDLCTGEVAALGYCTLQEDGFMYVDDLFLIPQEVSSGGVDFLEEGLPYAVDKAAQDGRIDDLRFCIHSHGSMSTFFSTTDEEMIQQIKKAAPQLPWFVSAVFNRKHETYAQIDCWVESPIPGFSHVVLKADIFSESNIAIVDAAKKDLDEFVKEKKFKAGVDNKNDTVDPVSGTPTSQQKSHDQQAWGEDTRLDKQLREQAMREAWDVVEDSDGLFHFFGKGGGYEGQAVGPDVEDKKWIQYIRDNNWPGEDS